MELKEPRLLYAKALGFIVIGAIGGTLLILDQPTLRTVILLCLVIWAMCRAYYFAFYVMQRWVDPNYRFTGLLSMARFLLKSR